MCVEGAALGRREGCSVGRGRAGLRSGEGAVSGRREGRGVRLREGISE